MDEPRKEEEGGEGEKPVELDKKTPTKSENSGSDDDNNEVIENDEEDLGENPSKRARNEFILHEAEEAEREIEEEEYGDYEEDAGEMEELKEDMEGRMIHRQKEADEAGDANNEVDDIIRRIEDRYQTFTAKPSEFTELQVVDEKTEQIVQQATLPTSKDPKLWLVRCKPGKERLAVIELMNRALALAKNGVALPISTAVATSTSGFVYVEAEKPVHVQKALAGNRLLFPASVKAVPLGEMTQVFWRPDSKKSTQVIVKNQWVQVKRGLYSGDIGVVYDTDAGSQVSTVKLVPRIDIDRIKERSMASTREDPGAKRKREANRSGPRPPQRLFKEDEVGAAGGDVRVSNVRHESGNRFNSFGGDVYYDGFLFKKIKNSSLEANAHPTLEEMKLFLGEDLDDSAVPLPEKELTLSEGDHVRVVDGALEGLIGRAVKVGKTEIEVRPLLDEIKDNILKFNKSQLRRHLRIGEHVTLVRGRYKGESGTILGVSKKSCAIFTDMTMMEIEALIDDVKVTTTKTNVISQKSDYRLYDLVQLQNNNEVAVIIRVEREMFEALNNVGENIKLAPKDIKKKLGRRNTVTLDGDFNHVRVGDVITIMDGPYKGKKAALKYSFRYTAFLHSNEIAENSGIVVVKTKSIKGDTRESANENPFANAIRHGPQRGFPRRGNALVNKDVVVNSGKFRGYKGTVTEASDALATVLLHATNRRLTLERGLLTIEDAEGARTMTVDYGELDAGYDMQKTPLNAPQTPMHDGMSTPSHVGIGTPSHDSASWNPDVLMTPGRPNTGGADYEDYSTYDNYNTYGTGSNWEDGGDATRGESGMDDVTHIQDQQVTPNILVRLTYPFENIMPGTHGVVREVLPSGMSKVLFQGFPNVLDVPADYIQNVLPRERDRVIIVGGESAGKVGMLKGMAENNRDYCIQLDDRDILIVDPENVAVIQQ